MIKGVPIELQIAYNQQPDNYLLLGLMAYAADEQGELEVGEALRWLWRWKRVPHTSYTKTLSGWKYYNLSLEVADSLPEIAHLVPACTNEDTPLRAVERAVIGLSKWKAQHSEEYHRLSVPPSISTPQTTPS